MRALLTVIAVVVWAGAVSAQESKPQPKRITCSVESATTLTCFDEELEQEFPIEINSRHPWAKYLEDTQAGVSKVVVEERKGQHCLMQVHVQGDWVRNPTNERINICVKRGKKTGTSRRPVTASGLLSQPSGT